MHFQMEFIRQFPSSSWFLNSKVWLKWPSYNLTWTYCYFYYYFNLSEKHFRQILSALNYPSTLDFAASICFFSSIVVSICCRVNVYGARQISSYRSSYPLSAKSAHYLGFPWHHCPQGHWLIVCNIHSKRTAIINTQNKVSIHLMFFTLATHHRRPSNE